MIDTLVENLNANGGVFITFEGGEGSGKTTQIKALSEALAAAGVDHIMTREPGGCPSAEELRNLILTGAKDRWTDMGELLLYTAARAEHLERVIRPALAAGKVVLCDRFADSTMVYQGISRGLGERTVEQLQTIVIGETAPDATVYFDIAPEIGLARSGGWDNGENRIEQEGLEFHTKVRDGFVALTKKHPERFVTIDASASVEDVFASLVSVLTDYFAFEEVKAA
ncbi:MAG: dTMP kinase [Alphaproteobacteria bacterium]|nr:dTMP kinase [Alphaproteobacteria bacterium]